MLIGLLPSLPKSALKRFVNRWIVCHWAPVTDWESQLDPKPYRTILHRPQPFRPRLYQLPDMALRGTNIPYRLHQIPISVTVKSAQTCHRDQICSDHFGHDWTKTRLKDVQTAASVQQETDHPTRSHAAEGRTDGCFSTAAN